jgi:hypothetical protein
MEDLRFDRNAAAAKAARQAAIVPPAAVKPALLRCHAGILAVLAPEKKRALRPGEISVAHPGGGP